MNVAESRCPEKRRGRPKLGWEFALNDLERVGEEWRKG